MGVMLEVKAFACKLQSFWTSNILNYVRFYYRIILGVSFDILLKERFGCLGEASVVTIMEVYGRFHVLTAVKDNRCSVVDYAEVTNVDCIHGEYMTMVSYLPPPMSGNRRCVLIVSGSTRASVS